MNPRLQQTLTRARGVAAGFTLGQKVVVVVGVLALVLGGYALTRWVSQPTWTPLFGQLSGADASAVVEELRAQNVPYQLVDGGSTILVPQAQVYDVRVALAGKGLPGNDSGSGWSILDKQGMTATDFQQNVAYQRAMESELSKTIGAMAGVKTAIVHLAIPKKDVFATEQDKPTASVLLQLKPGVSMQRGQIRAITHLVAGSVPGLDPAEVTVSDANGGMLSTREDGAAGAASAASQTDEQTAQYEERLGNSLQQMLDRVVGPGNAVVRVNAELDYNTKDTTSESYVATPNVPPLSEQTSKEIYTNGAAGAGGQLGVINPTPVNGANGNGSYSKEEQTRNNAVGKVVSREQAAPGGVKRLSVAVVLNATTAANTNPQQVSDLVSNAAGLNTQRGDTIKVDKLAFDQSVADAAKKDLEAQQKAEQTAQYLDIGKKAGLVLAALVVGFLLLRRRKSEPEPTVAATAEDLPQGILVDKVEAIGGDRVPALAAAPAEEQLPPGPDPVLERERLRDEVAGFVDSQPDEIAQLVSSWLADQR